MGNLEKVFSTLGASNHTEEDRQEQDFYATDPIAIKKLLEIERFNPNIWECASGENHLAIPMIEAGYNVRCSDIIKRTPSTEQLDFLKCDERWAGDIITNPPYKNAAEFVEKSMEVVQEGAKIAMFLKLLFLEGQKRKQLFQKYPPKVVYVSSSRIQCAKNGDFEKYNHSAIAYAWFIWEKGYKGETVVKWFN